MKRIRFLISYSNNEGNKRTINELHVSFKKLSSSQEDNLKVKTMNDASKTTMQTT